VPVSNLEFPRSPSFHCAAYHVYMSIDLLFLLYLVGSNKKASVEIEEEDHGNAFIFVFFIC